MRLRLLGVATIIVVLGACGSDAGDTRPTIAATFPPVGSVVAPSGSDAEVLPPETQPAPTQPAQTPPVEQLPEETALIEPTAPAAVTETTPPTESSSDDGTVWWPWVLGAIILIGVIAAVARRRPSGPSWQTRATGLLDEIEQLTSHLVAVTPAGLQAIAQADAMALATMRATLRDLIESAPDVTSRTVMAGLTTPIAELHGAIDAIALSVQPSPTQPGPAVSQLAAQLHTISTSVRAQLAVHPS